MSVQRLAPQWESAVEELLVEEVETNLFLLSILEDYPMDKLYWYGVVDGDRLEAVALALPPKLAVPYGRDPVKVALLGRHLRDRFDPMMIIGPRAASDALWRAWAGRTPPVRWYHQRLYVTRTAPPGPPVPGFRPALMREWETIAAYSAHMELEDLGLDPSVVDPQGHARAVKLRIQRRATWVIERGGELVFHINVGTDMALGSQVGGTYVPPRHRGRGLATEGMRALLVRLLGRRPVVTLHVNEANAPAVRVYEKVGLQRDAPFRLVTVSP